MDLAAQPQDPSAATRTRAPQRIGVHVGTAGGCWTAVGRAVAAGANTFQIFSSSPRTWRAPAVKPEDASKMRSEMAAHDVGPLVVHASYLINLPSQTEAVRKNSVSAFRGEVERALALGASFLVLHAGSWNGLTREQGLDFAEQGIERAIDGIDFTGQPLRILIENTAGAPFSLGSSFEQVAELVARLRSCGAPVDVCLDTCHCHVAGYDLVTTEGYEQTVALAASTFGLDAVRVWHCNDAKAPLGSKLDRHEHIGEGTLGAAAFGRLLHDPRFSHAVFIAETPVDEPGDELRNVSALRALAATGAQLSGEGR